MKLTSSLSNLLPKGLRQPQSRFIRPAQPFSPYLATNTNEGTSFATIRTRASGSVVTPETIICNSNDRLKPSQPPQLSVKESITSARPIVNSFPDLPSPPNDDLTHVVATLAQDPPTTVNTGPSRSLLEFKVAETLNDLCENSERLEEWIRRELAFEDREGLTCDLASLNLGELDAVLSWDPPTSSAPRTTIRSFLDTVVPRVSWRNVFKNSSRQPENPFQPLQDLSEQSDLFKAEPNPTSVTHQNRDASKDRASSDSLSSPTSSNKRTPSIIPASVNPLFLLCLESSPLSKWSKESYDSYKGGNTSTRARVRDHFIVEWRRFRVRKRDPMSGNRHEYLVVKIQGPGKESHFLRFERRREEREFSFGGRSGRTLDWSPKLDTVTMTNGWDEDDTLLEKRVFDQVDDRYNLLDLLIVAGMMGQIPGNAVEFSKRPSHWFAVILSHVLDRNNRDIKRKYGRKYERWNPSSLLRESTTEERKCALRYIFDFRREVWKEGSKFGR